MLTPFQYSSNRPIDGVDWDGLEFRQSPGIYQAYAPLPIGRFTIPSHGAYDQQLRANNLHPYYSKTLKISTQEQLDNAMGSTDAGKMNVEDGGRGMEGHFGAAPGFVQEIINRYSPEFIAYEDVQEQKGRFKAAERVVDQAKVLGLIPDQFKDNPQFYADLVNFIFDGSEVSGVGEKAAAYNKLIKHLGEEFYKHRAEISSGVYKRDSKSVIRHTPSFSLDQPYPGRSYQSRLYEKVSKLITDEEVQKLVENYNKAKGGCDNCPVIKKKQ